MGERLGLRALVAVAFLAGLAVPEGRAAYADAGRYVYAELASSTGSSSTAPAGSCRPLSDRRLAELVRRWPAGERPTAFAVALGESDGRPCAVGDVDLQGDGWGPSVCPWQLRSRVGDHSGGVRDRAANLRSVETCARNARGLWAGEGWRPWSAYTNGTYARHLPRARAALGKD